MEQIGKLLSSNNSLAPKSDAITATSLQSLALEQLQQGPAWEMALFQIAQDKRHDLPPETMQWWREKLKAYRDEEICAAVKLYAGEFFPSVDDITGVIERRRKDAATNRPWEQFKAGQAQAAVEGKLATDEDYAELREVFRRVAFGGNPND